MRRKAQSKLPSEIMRRKIQFGTPELDGVYVVFSKKWNKNTQLFPMSETSIVEYKKKWLGSKHIIAWIGPIPTVSIDELIDQNSFAKKVFVISEIKKIFDFERPFFSYKEATKQKGRKGLFIFELNTHKSLPIPVAKYTTKWKKISNKAKPKYTKMVTKYQKGL